MDYLGDFATDAAVNIYFTTEDSSGGIVAPSSAFEAADVVVYKNNSATQRTSANGITMTSPFDSVTGLHQVSIDLTDNSDPGFWAAGNDYVVVLTPDETVDGQTVVYVLATFSVANRYTDVSAIAQAIAVSSNALIGEIQDDNGNGTDPLNGVSFVGTVDGGTIANVDVADGSYYVLGDTTNAFDLVFEYKIPANTIAIAVEFEGYLTGSNDVATVQVYNHVATAWVSKATIIGKAVATADNISVPLGAAKWSSSTGVVYVRFVTSGQSTPTLYIDRCVVTYQSETIGYTGGFIYYDSGASNTDTNLYFDGTADNPVSSWAAVKTLLAAARLNKVDVVGTLTLDSTAEGIALIEAHRATLALGGQAIGGVEFLNFADITGTGTSTGARPVFTHSSLGDTSGVTLPPSFLRYCEIGITGLTFGSGGAWDFDHCHSGVAGPGAPLIDCDSTDNNTIGISDWLRGLTLSGLAANDVVTANGVFNTLTLNGADATVNVSGQTGTVTNNLTGSPSVTETNSITLTSGNVNTNLKAIDDDANAAARLALSAANMVPGTVIAGTLSTYQMTTNLTETTDDHFNGRLVLFTSGALTGQVTDVVAYDGATKRITMTTLTEAPSANDTFILV